MADRNEPAPPVSPAFVPADSGSRLQATVIDGGYCIGCGACAVGMDPAFRIVLDDDHRLVAVPAAGGNRPAERDAAARVCPFSDRAQDEHALGEALYGEDCRLEEGLGWVRSTWLGHVADPELRGAASSGGIVTWLLCRLLEKGEVDGVVHVVPRRPSEADPRIYRYAVSRTAESVVRGARSHYYPVEMSGVLDEVRAHPGRYVVVGVPCFVKAVRLLAREDPLIRERVAFCIALFCGHLKSARFADLFAWQCGIAPGGLEAFDFRVKIEGQPANRYGIRAIGRGSAGPVDAVRTANELRGRDWGMGFFRYSACDYCDDVVGETADLSVGDAWLRECIPDWRGSSVVVVRDPVLGALLEQGIEAGELELGPIAPDRVRESQAANYRHRRDGLRYRLLLKDRQGLWRPPKRVEPGEDHLDSARRRLYELRMRISTASDRAFREAVERGSLERFGELMAQLERQYLEVFEATRPVPPSPPLMRRLSVAVHRQLGRLARLVLGSAYDRMRGRTGSQGGADRSRPGG